MKVNIALGETPEDFGLKGDNDISKIYKYMVNSFNININDNYQRIADIDFPKEVNIDVILVNGNEIFKQYFEDEDAKRTYGLFPVNDGEDEFGNEKFLNKYMVFVDASEKTFKESIKKHSPKDVESFVNMYLVTMTHELQHALEFIENSGGLTPHQVDKYNKEGKFPYTVDDCCTGFNLPKYKEQYQNINDEDKIYQITEDRVERNGRDMFFDLNVPYSLISKLIPKKKNTLKMR